MAAKTPEQKKTDLLAKRAEYLAEITGVRERARIEKVSASYARNVEIEYAAKIIAIDRKLDLLK